MILDSYFIIMPPNFKSLITCFKKLINLEFSPWGAIIDNYILKKISFQN